MELVDILVLTGLVICGTATFIILIKYFIDNGNFFVRRRNRRNRISPEMFAVLSSLIEERNRVIQQRERHRQQEMEKQLELDKLKHQNTDIVIIINPDNKIQLGESK